MQSHDAACEYVNLYFWVYIVSGKDYTSYTLINLKIVVFANKINVFRKCQKRWALK